MKRGNLFWGLILLFIGAFLLGRSLEIIPKDIDLFGVLIPFALIIFGVLILLKGSSNRVNPVQPLVIPLEDANRVDLEIDHGAGMIRVDGRAPSGVALAVNQGSGFDHKVTRTPGVVMINVDAGPTFIPFLGPESGEWVFSLTNQKPVTLNIEAGATRLDLDLTDTKLSLLKVSMGAAGFKCALPANAGSSVVDVECGMATLEFILPAEVGAKVLLKQGASATDLDLERFDLLSQNPALYQTKNYADALNRVDLNLEGGANSIVIK